MTTIAETSIAGQSSATSALAAQSTSDAETAISDFNDFLTLLTAQLNNQDPLNPLDSTQFVEQLATFTSVEQQIGTNTRLDELIAGNGAGELAELATWIGREVQARGAGFSFDGSSMTIDMPGRADAARGSVVIRGSDNREVATLPADPAGGSVVWDGTTTAGGTAAPGVYQVEFVYGFGAPGTVEERSETLPAEGVGRVVEARLGEGGAAELVLDSGVVVSPSAVSALRLADDEA